MRFNIYKLRKRFAKNQASFKGIHENILEGRDVHGSNFIILICAIIIAPVGLKQGQTLMM